MRNALFALVVSVLPLKIGHAEDPVFFANVDLQMAIEYELWLSDPTPTDMLGLTNLSYSGWGGQNGVITDLTGLEHAVNLQSLSLTWHGFSSLSALSGLTNLEELDVRECPVTDIAPLAALHRLSWLNLHKTQVSSIAPLIGLTSLSYVDLRGAPLDLDAYEIYIPQLRMENPDITILCDPYRPQPHVVTITHSGGGSILSPGAGVFVYEHGHVACLEAQTLPGFVFLGWSGANDSVQNPLCFSVVQDSQIRARFVSICEELYVDDDSTGDPWPDDSSISDPCEDGTDDHPFDSIQEAIEVAMDGTTIVVRPGIYREHVNLLGKKLHLVAIDPANPQGGPCATIDGMDSGPAVAISAEGGRECSLSGFVITRGNGQLSGGIYCTNTSPTISNCLIIGNRCNDANGTAAYFYNSQALLTNCTIADNYGGADATALALVDSNIVMISSILWGNSCHGIACRGTSDPSIRYCCIQGGWLDTGNMQTDPLFARRGSWASRPDPNRMLLSQDAPSVWMNGDYHLRSQIGRWDSTISLWVCDDLTSPCIDAGDPADGIGYEPLPNGAIINMGAYGGTARASMSR